jgi:hypothetical protein
VWDLRWYRHACPVCAGDLHDDLEEKGSVTCFACGRTFSAATLGLTPRMSQLPGEREENKSVDDDAET